MRPRKILQKSIGLCAAAAIETSICLACSSIFMPDASGFRLSIDASDSSRVMRARKYAQEHFISRENVARGMPLLPVLSKQTLARVHSSRLFEPLSHANTRFKMRPIVCVCACIALNSKARLFAHAMCEDTIDHVRFARCATSVCARAHNISEAISRSATVE